MCPQAHHFDHSHAVQTVGISTPTNFSLTVSTKKLGARLRVGSAFVPLLITAWDIHRDVAFCWNRCGDHIAFSVVSCRTII